MSGGGITLSRGDVVSLFRALVSSERGLRFGFSWVMGNKVKVVHSRSHGPFSYIVFGSRLIFA